MSKVLFTISRGGEECYEEKKFWDKVISLDYPIIPENASFKEIEAIAKQYEQNIIVETGINNFREIYLIIEEDIVFANILLKLLLQKRICQFY